MILVLTWSGRHHRAHERCSPGAADDLLRPCPLSAADAESNDREMMMSENDDPSGQIVDAGVADPDVATAVAAAALPVGFIEDYISRTVIKAGPEELEAVQVMSRRLVE